MRVKLLADVTPLRESPAFRRMWAGGVMSAVGGALTNFAVTLQVYELTKSPAAVGLLGLAVLVPTLAVGLFGGAAADALDRRKVVLAATAAQALVSAALAAQAYAGLGWVWLLYVLVAAASAVEAVNVPARRAAAARPAGRRAGAEPADVPGHDDRRPGIGRGHRGRPAPGVRRLLPDRFGQLHGGSVRGDPAPLAWY